MAYLTNLSVYVCFLSSPFYQIYQYISLWAPSNLTRGKHSFEQIRSGIPFLLENQYDILSD